MAGYGVESYGGRLMRSYGLETKLTLNSFTRNRKLD